MKQSGQCPKCQSLDIVADAKAIDHGHNNTNMELTVATFRHPEALLFKGKQTTTLSAWVCVSCGYTEFYADHPTNLLPEVSQ